MIAHKSAIAAASSKVEFAVAMTVTMAASLLRLQ